MYSYIAKQERLILLLIYLLKFLNNVLQVKPVDRAAKRTSGPRQGLEMWLHMSVAFVKSLSSHNNHEF